MNSDRDEFRLVPIQILLSDYMRPVEKTQLRPGRLVSVDRPKRKSQTGSTWDRDDM